MIATAISASSALVGRHKRNPKSPHKSNCGLFVSVRHRDLFQKGMHLEDSFKNNQRPSSLFHIQIINEASDDEKKFSIRPAA
jgi:hypothetical protein